MAPSDTNVGSPNASNSAKTVVPTTFPNRYNGKRVTIPRTVWVVGTYSQHTLEEILAVLVHCCSRQCKPYTVEILEEMYEACRVDPNLQQLRGRGSTVKSSVDGDIEGILEGFRRHLAEIRR